MVDDYSLALQQAKEDISLSAQSQSLSQQQSAREPENITEGIWAYDVPNNRIYWSTQLFDMFGITRQESPLTLESMMALTHSPEERQNFEKIIQTSLSTGEPFVGEFGMHHQSGQRLSTRITGKVYLDADRTPSRISGQMASITQLQEASTSLEKANRDLSDLQHVLDESTLLAVTDRYGVITYLNDALCRIFQYSRDELMGETLEFTNAGGYPQHFLREMWDVIESGQVWRGDIKHRAKDGTFFWMDTTIVPLLDIHGEPMQYVVVRYDITRQMTAEQEGRELRESMETQVDTRTSELENINRAQSLEIAEQQEIEAELKKSLKREKLTKHLIQLMNRSFEPGIILEIIVRELGTFFDVDRCLVALYRNETEEEDEGPQIFAQYCRSEAVHPVQEEEVLRASQELLNDQEITGHSSVILNTTDLNNFPPGIQNYLKKNQVKSAFAIEIKFRRMAFGWLILHQCNHSRIWTDSEKDFLEVLATHIGAALYQAKLYQWEKQAKQEAEEANRQKSKILSFVSHDFKNPLASMKRFISILENDKSDLLSGNHRELIGYIAEGVYQLRNMVLDILDKARLEEGKITPAPQWVELASFIDELKPMFNAMASQRNIEVSIEIQPDLTAIKADPTHLRQILINLMSNAMKYNRINGKASLKIYQPEDKQFAVIEVHDTGLGIPSEKIPQLFTEYFRGDLSQSNMVEGTGLGLAFIKKLIELSGGDIQVESTPGEGSTFIVYLPGQTQESPASTLTLQKSQ